MESVSSLALAVLFLAVFANYRNGTLGDWARAKFFNQAPGERRGDGTPTSARRVVPATGSFGRPVAGSVTGWYGDPRDGRSHAGIDFAVPTGTPVRASAAGRVIAAGAAGGYGLRIDVDHGNGRVTRYAHLDRLGVGVGTIVGAGDVLGLSGNTGESTGPHLHFEIIEFGRPVDPARIIGLVSPRLVR